MLLYFPHVQEGDPIALCILDGDGCIVRLLPVAVAAFSGPLPLSSSLGLV